MELLNSTKCVCGKDLSGEKFDKYTPKAMNDRFYGGRVSMEAEVKCECGRELKGYFEVSKKMNSNSNYDLIDLEVIKDTTEGEKIENTPTSEVENEQKEENTEETLNIVEDVVEYNPKSYEDMSYGELQAMCKERGIKAKGKKDDLIKLLKG